MNQTESKAFAWLKTQGYQETDIIEQKNKTPDFITKDGVGYEVKLVYGKVIWFHEEQFELLKQQENIIVLVFRKNSDQPILQIPTTELEIGKIFNGIKVVVAPLSTSIVLPKELMNKVKEYNKTHANRPINVSGVCRIALEQELHKAIKEG